MAVTFVAAGTQASNTNASVTPSLPAGLTDGDLMLCVGSMAAPARTFTATGWSTTQYATNTSTDGPRIWLAWRVYVTGDAAATFTIGGTSKPGAAVLARVFGFRGCSSTPTLGTAYTSGATAGTNAGPVTGVAVTGAGLAVAIGAWASDYTTAPSAAGWTAIGTNETTGSTVNTSIYVGYQATTSTTSPSVTVTGTPTASATRAGIQVGLDAAPTNLNKLRAGTGTVLLRAGASAASKAYIGTTQVWP